MVAEVVKPAHDEHPVAPEQEPGGEHEARERDVLLEARDEGHLNVLRRHPGDVVLKRKPVLGEVGKECGKKEKEDRSREERAPPRTARGRKRKDRTECVGHEELSFP